MSNRHNNILPDITHSSPTLSGTLVGLKWELSGTYSEYHPVVPTLPPKKLAAIIAGTLPVRLSVVCPAATVVLLILPAALCQSTNDHKDNNQSQHISIVFVGCYQYLFNLSATNPSISIGSKNFPFSEPILQARCRCGPVVRFPVFPLIAITCPA